MEVAISLGTDPITTYAGSVPLPKHIDELLWPACCATSRSSWCSCKTVDLEVPANAEIVIEGYGERGELAPEGPFGDHTGYYTPTEPFPLLHVTRITTAATRSTRRSWSACRRRRTSGSARRPSASSCRPCASPCPEIVDYDLPFAGAFHNCCIVSIRKRFPGHAQQGDARDLGNGAPVPHEGGGGGRRVGRRARLRAGRLAARRERRSGRDVLLSHGPLDQLDHAPNLASLGGKIGFDATRTWPEEGYPREWPEVARMSDDVREQVDARWSEFGIELGRRGADAMPRLAQGRRGIFGKRGS